MESDKMKSSLASVAEKPVSRRSLLKGAAVLGGSTLVTGFPTVWAQTIKDITLNHVGMSYSVLPDIARRASEDLGFKIEMSVTDQSGMTNRAINDPASIDIADIEIWQTKLIVPQGGTQAIDIKRITNWNQLTPLYTQGKFQGKEMSRQGSAPILTMYRDAINATEFATSPTDWATIVPSVYNADTLGLRPDLIKKPIDSWASLVSDEFKGRTAIQNIPTNGIMDAIMALEAAGERAFADKGNPTREDIEWVIKRLIELKRDGHFRALWSTFDESINLMASGEVVLQSMWSPAVTAVKIQGVECVYQPLKEGYRSWGNGLALMSHLEGMKLDAAYEYLNWYNSGFVGAFIAKQGYYSANPETAKAQLSENERGFFYEGKPAIADITSPSGEKTNSAGEVRDGGSYEERFSKVAVWNNLMNEAEFLYAKWNEFSAA